MVVVQPAIPTAVLSIIAGHLRNSHACETCYLRDLAAAAATCRGWRDGLVPVMSVSLSALSTSSYLWVLTAVKIPRHRRRRLRGPLAL